MKIADLPLVVYTHHDWANTDIVNLAIIDGLTKNLCRKKNCCPFCYDVYQCIVADVEYFGCAFIMRGGPGIIFPKPPLKVWVYKT